MIKDFIKRKVAEYKEDLELKQKVKDADKQAYYKARIDSADDIAKAKVKEEIEQVKLKEKVKSEQKPVDILGNLSEALNGSKSKHKDVPSVFDIKI